MGESITDCVVDCSGDVASCAAHSNGLLVQGGWGCFNLSEIWLRRNKSIVKEQHEDVLVTLL